jgi:hypothetical protein
MDEDMLARRMVVSHEALRSWADELRSCSTAWRTIDLAVNRRRHNGELCV